MYQRKLPGPLAWPAAICKIRSHIPTCVFNKGCEGDLFSQHVPDKAGLCQPEMCRCLPYPGSVDAVRAVREIYPYMDMLAMIVFRDPSIEFRAGCSTNPMCPTNKACVCQKCVDACPGSVGNMQFAVLFARVIRDTLETLLRSAHQSCLPEIVEGISDLTVPGSAFQHSTTCQSKQTHPFHNNSARFHPLLTTIIGG